MLAKGNVIFDKGACAMAGRSDTTLKDIYMQSIDPAGVMLNSQQNGGGVMTFIPMRFVAAVELTKIPPPPQVQTPAFAMPPRRM